MNKGYYALLLKSLLAKREKNRQYRWRYIKRWILIFMQNYFCMICFANIFPMVVTWLMSTQQDYFLYNLVVLLPLYFPVIANMIFYLLKCAWDNDICEFKLINIIHSLIPLLITIQITSIKFDGYTTNYSAIIFERKWFLVSLIYVCVYCMFRSVIGAPNSYLNIDEIDIGAKMRRLRNG